MRFRAHDVRVVVSLQYVIGLGQHDVATEVFGEHGDALSAQTYGVMGIAFGDATCRDDGKIRLGALVVLHTGRLAAVSEQPKEE